MFSPHRKDAYQIISQNDIPDLFYYSEAHCSAVDLQRNQTCLSASGCTAGFACWPTQRYPDVATHSSLCKLTAYLQLLCSPQVHVHIFSYSMALQKLPFSQVIVFLLPAESSRGAHLQDSPEDWRSSMLTSGQVLTQARMLVLPSCLAPRRSQF